MYLESGHLATRAHFTDPGLFEQLALSVAVGHPGGHPAATGFGAWGPGCGMGHTLHPSEQHVA